MHRKLKNLWPLATLSMVTGTCALSALDDAHVRNLENRVTALESRKGNCCMVNPSARPFNAECWGAYVTVDPFIWKGHMNGLSYGIKTADGAAFQNATGSATVLNPKSDWDWGVRVGVGFNWADDGWDSLLQWTYWKTHSTSEYTVKANEAVYPSQGIPAIIQESSLLETDIAKNQFGLRLNHLDLENGRQFYVSKSLTLRPHAGIRSTWIEGKADTFYTGLGLNPEPTPPFSPENVVVDHHFNFWGMGVRMGLDLQWGLGCGVSIFSNWADSILAGNFKDSVAQYSVDTSGVATQQQATKNSFHWGTQLVDMQIGVRYDWLSCDECYHLGVDLGWENHLAHGLNQLTNFPSLEQVGKVVVNQGNLNTQGLFLKLRFDF